MTFGTAMLLVAALQGAPAAPSMRTIDRGDQSNIDEPKQLVVRTAAEWNTLWRQHSAGRAQPAVDWPKDMVLAVFLGTRSSAGYSVEIVSAKEEQGTLLVTYRERRPARDAVTAQILTFPYHIVAVPASAAPVRFEKVQ